MFKKYHQQLSNIFWISSIASAILMLIIFIVQPLSLTQLLVVSSGWFYVAVIFINAIGTIIIRYKIQNINVSMAIAERLKIYKRCFWAKILLTFLMTFWFSMVFYQSDKYIWGYGAAFMLFIFAITYPYRERLIKDLQLTASELH